MIKSVNSDSVYLSLQTKNSLLKKLTSTTEVNNGSVLVNESSVTSSESSSKSDNSVLSIEELVGMMQSYQKPVAVSPVADQSESDSDLGSIDADGDGTISVDEYEAAMIQMGVSEAASSEDFFAQIDSSSDGEISTDELNARKPMGPLPMGMTPEDDQDFLSSIDADGDSSISTDEYELLLSQLNISDAASSEDFFSRFDVNSDGEITADEIASAQNTSTQSITEVYKNLAASALNAYETNYQYMFGTDNTNLSSIV